VTSGVEAEHPLDEMVLGPNATLPDPPDLSLPNLEDCLVALNRPQRTAELTKMLLGTDPSLDGTVNLLQDVVEIWNRPMMATRR
jgi:hypothetical protein